MAARKLKTFGSISYGIHSAPVHQNDGHRFHLGNVRVLRNRNRLRMGVHPLMTPWELVMGSVMAVGLTVYLVYAMLRPEKF